MIKLPSIHRNQRLSTDEVHILEQKTNMKLNKQNQYFKIESHTSVPQTITYLLNK